eukprot:gene7873-16115_t
MAARCDRENRKHHKKKLYYSCPRFVIAYPQYPSSSRIQKNLRAVNDCRCDFGTANKAVKDHFAPILANLTALPFYRYFRVDLERPCPFWREEGQCAYEGCSICTCEEGEVPHSWIVNKEKDSDSDEEYGWFSHPSSRETHDDHERWIDMSEHEDYPSPHKERRSMFVNLLKNPERFTGYSGPSARRVWQSMGQENCFGGDEDTCLEKRIFFRLMSGLQASISTHIARQYYSPDLGWHANHTMFHRAVGAHPMRLHNMYFTFLFLLRAAARAGEQLLLRPLEGLEETMEGDKHHAIRLVRELVRTNLADIEDTWNPDSDSGYSVATSSSRHAPQQCREAFDESLLFQVPQSTLIARQPKLYWDQLHEKQQLREEFRSRFRNISRILDCVTCEKCRVWSKLQVLGIGTAIRILLTPEEDLVAVASRPSGSCEGLWAPSRQEVISLLNSLNQFAKSVSFANSAFERPSQDGMGTGTGTMTGTDSSGTAWWTTAISLSSAILQQTMVVVEEYRTRFLVVTQPIWTRLYVSLEDAWTRFLLVVVLLVCFSWIHFCVAYRDLMS